MNQLLTNVSVVVAQSKKFYELLDLGSFPVHGWFFPDSSPVYGQGGKLAEPKLLYISLFRKLHLFLTLAPE